MTPDTIGQAVNDLAARFDAAGLDTPRLDARLLVGHALGLEPSMLFARTETLLSADDKQRIAAVAARRLACEPVSRIVGTREFWGLSFRLTSDTLDPRPDTETVVSAALARKARYGAAPVRILDLGTGTGCILMAVLSAWPEATGVGIDINPGAVTTAQENAARLGLSRRALFRMGNWCESEAGPFDVIVSNPPYIADHELTGLSAEVTQYDPMIALHGGSDGLVAYRALIPQAYRCLAPDGALLLEIGSTQAEAVSALLREAGFRAVTQARDLGGLVRCLIATQAQSTNKSNGLRV